MFHYTFTKDWCKNPSLKFVWWICRKSWTRIPNWKTCHWKVSIYCESISVNTSVLQLRFTEALHFRVVSVEPLSMRIEVTLRTTSTTKAPKSDISNFDSLHVGDIISGRIKRVESYGLFITIDHTNIVSNCILLIVTTVRHFSEYLSRNI